MYQTKKDLIWPTKKCTVGVKLCAFVKVNQGGGGQSHSARLKNKIIIVAKNGSFSVLWQNYPSSKPNFRMFLHINKLD